MVQTIIITTQSQTQCILQTTQISLPQRLKAKVCLLPNFFPLSIKDLYQKGVQGNKAHIRSPTSHLEMDVMVFTERYFGERKKVNMIKSQSCLKL